MSLLTTGRVSAAARRARAAAAALYRRGLQLVDDDMPCLHTTDAAFSIAVYVRGVDGNSLSPFVSSVVFTLHPSFENNVREVMEEPFAVAEKGWGECASPAFSVGLAGPVSCLLPAQHETAPHPTSRSLRSWSVPLGWFAVVQCGSRAAIRVARVLQRA